MPEDSQEAPAPELDSQELVRVKLPNGAEATLGRSFAECHELEVLDKPATIRGHALDASPPPGLTDAPEVPVETPDAPAPVETPDAPEAPVDTPPTPAGGKPSRSTQES